jgi:hypothetical protein
MFVRLLLFHSETRRTVRPPILVVKRVVRLAIVLSIGRCTPSNYPAESTWRLTYFCAILQGNAVVGDMTQAHRTRASARAFHGPTIERNNGDSDNCPEYHIRHHVRFSASPAFRSLVYIYNLVPNIDSSLSQLSMCVTPLQLWPDLFPGPVEHERPLFLHPLHKLRSLRIGHEGSSLTHGT